MGHADINWSSCHAKTAKRWKLTILMNNTRNFSIKVVHPVTLLRSTV